MRTPCAATTPPGPLDADSDCMRLALELSGTGLWSWDVGAQVVLLSKECRRIVRCDKPQHSARDFLAMVHGQDRDALQQAIRQALESGQALALEFRLMAIDGAVVEVTMRGRCVPPAAEQRPTRLCGTLAEIAHRPPASTPRPNADEVAQAAISALPGAAAFVVDRQLRYVLAQGQALRAAGLHHTHFEGRTLAEILAAEMLQDHEADYRRALEGQTFRREHRVAERHFVTHGVPLRGRDEQVWAALAFSCDVTEFKQAQEALQRSEALLSAVLDALPVGVIIADADGRIVRDNAANRQLWGVPPQTSSWQQYGQWEGYWPETGQRIQAHEWAMARALRTGEQVMGELVECVPFGSGERRMYLNTAAPIQDDSGQIVGAVVAELDVTARMRTERSLREREHELRTLADNVPDILARFDCELRHVFVNGAVTLATGRPPSDFIGRTNRELGMPALLCDLWDTSILKAFLTAQPQAVEFEFDSPTGRRSYMGRFIPERDAAGQIAHVLGIMSDVTAQRQAQQAVLEASRRKDEFLATLAHELRNPLSPMLTSLQLLRRVMPQTPQAEQVLGIFERQVAQLMALVDDLMDVARIGQGKVLLRPQLLRLDEVLQTCVDECAALIAAKGHQLTLRLPEQPVWLQADRARMVQVFANLLGNAAKYTPPGGEICIEASVQDDLVEVHVRDNGLGITPELLPRVFDLFTQGQDSLEHAQGGLGIGLALVRRLVEMHRGLVHAESTGAGQGSTFTVTLPCIRPAPQLPSVI